MAVTYSNYNTTCIESYELRRVKCTLSHNEIDEFFGKQWHPDGMGFDVTKPVFMASDIV